MKLSLFLGPILYQVLTILLSLLTACINHIHSFISGAPNENIVQNHLNIALLSVFCLQTVDIGIFLSAKIFPSVQIS